LDTQIEKTRKKDGKEYIPGGSASSVYFYEAGPACIDFDEKKGTTQFLDLPDSCILQEDAFAMFSPQSIAQVIQQASKAAPAQNYILLLAGHAGGWEVASDGEYPQPNQAPASAVSDPHYKKRGIKAKELHDGIQQSGIHITSIIFDCCMMNNIEYLSELVDVTDYTFASGHTSKGSNLDELVDILYSAKNIEGVLKQLTVADRNAHTKNFKDEQDPRDRNTDFAAIKMSAMPSVWNALKGVTDYLCANVKDSAKYVIPSTKCYQYYNNDCKYDLMDYLTLMKSEGAPFQDDEGFNTVYLAMESALKSAIFAHEEGHEYVDGYQPAHPLTISIHLGAKGRLQSSFSEDGNEGGYPCFDYEGAKWMYHPAKQEGKKDSWTSTNKINRKYNWQYSYDKSVFDQKTGWTRWLKANPAMPYNNPPQGDDDDYNNDDDDDDEEEEGDEGGNLKDLH
jgi:hypothetical protein